jgi:hypothetical protein
MNVHPLAIGVEIEKVNSELNDGHKDGTRGKIVSVLGPVDPVIAAKFGSQYGYFILWEDCPIPVFTGSKKVLPRGIKAD